MKPGWRTVRFGDVCDLRKGKKPSLLAGSAAGAKPYLVAKYLRGMEAAKYALITDSNSVSVSPDEPIIICDGSNSGETFIGFDGVLSSTMAKVAHGSELDPHFLRYFLDSRFERFNATKTGAAIPHLDLGALRDEVLPVPPLREQKRIVTVLQQAFAAVQLATQNAERNLHNAREIFESYSNAILSQSHDDWIEASLSDLCEIRHGFAFKSEYFVDKGENVLLTPGNFYERGGYRDRCEKQKFYEGEVPPNTVLDAGDLLVAMTEQAAGLLGSALIVPENGRFLHNQRLGKVVAKQGVPWVTEFFYRVFNSLRVRKAIHDGATGVKVRHTSPTKIGSVIVSFPKSVLKQRAIARDLAHVERKTNRLEVIYSQKQQCLWSMERMLLTQAFSGSI